MPGTHGIDPDRYYEFDAFVSDLKLKGIVPNLLLVSLKSDSEFLEVTTQQRFFFGRTGIKHLDAIKNSVKNANLKDCKRKNKKRTKHKIN